MFDGYYLFAWIAGPAFLYCCVEFAVHLHNAPLIAESDPAGISRFDAADGVGADLVAAGAHEARMNARAQNVGMPR